MASWTAITISLVRTTITFACVCPYLFLIGFRSASAASKPWSRRPFRWIAGRWSISGPNGAGKSTTMRMITQFIEPDAGSISSTAFRSTRLDARPSDGSATSRKTTRSTPKCWSRSTWTLWAPSRPRWPFAPERDRRSPTVRRPVRSCTSVGSAGTSRCATSGCAAPNGPPSAGPAGPPRRLRHVPVGHPRPTGSPLTARAGRPAARLPPSALADNPSRVRAGSAPPRPAASTPAAAVRRRTTPRRSASGSGEATTTNAVPGAFNSW